MTFAQFVGNGMWMSQLTRMDSDVLNGTTLYTETTLYQSGKGRVRGLVHSGGATYVKRLWAKARKTRRGDGSHGFCSSIPDSSQRILHSEHVYLHSYE